VTTTDPGVIGVAAVKLKVAFPLASVVTGSSTSMAVWPSPLPEGASHVGLVKNSRWKLRLGVLLKVPWIVVEPAKVLTKVITGKFCKLFDPVSPSPASLVVTPTGARSIPSRPLLKIELPRIELPVGQFGALQLLSGSPTKTPSPALSWIEFPLMVLLAFAGLRTRTPWPAFPGSESVEPVIVLLLTVLLVPLIPTPVPRLPEITFRVTTLLLPPTFTPLFEVPNVLLEIVFPVTVLLVPPRLTPFLLFDIVLP
jgi:hypothetical protein